MKKNLGIAVGLLCLGLIIIGSLSNIGISNIAKNNKSDVYINPGAPKSPVGLSDWFKAGKKDAENPGLSEVLKKADYPLLLRADGQQPMKPIRVFVQPQVISPDDKIIEGFSLRYSDRIQLMIDPVNNPLDIQEEISREQLANTKGITKPYFAVNVRGFKGTGREAGIQKWENGEENHYPSMIQWNEKGNDSVPYLLYTLLGDCSVSELKDIAASLVSTK